MNGIKFAMLVALLGISPVLMQEPTAGAGYAVKVEFENEQIRVTRVHYAARAQSPMHSHTGRAVIALTGSHLRVTSPVEQLGKRNGIPAKSMGRHRDALGGKSDGSAARDDRD